ncbi:MAG: hypothetical protein AMXMBFR61_16430 [Fimbriimonadales bacterium]
MTLPADALSKLYGLTRFADVEPRFNIAPSQRVPAIRLDAEGERELALLQWGLVPGWAKDTSIGAKLFNARSETVAEKPSFRNAFRKRRCLMPADGFYEWQPTNGRKQPVYIRLAGGEPFAFASLWEIWKSPDGEVLETCTLLTTEPNEVMAPIHNRMPVILRPEESDAWLAPEARLGDLLGLLKPFPSEAMEVRPVSTYVNNPRNEGPECIRAVA